ncbi:VOC family protein [Bacteroides sp.]|uniref:VOC family protein n=1 Tax=Bacteroides sp. TaxID=29523 RepID=UPI0023C5566C|nr:VOC family protein [Bacteroides sp.]MDE6216238.1 VOC family protein [Bacteroides sp.]
MNRINVIALGVRDMRQSLRFYRDGLGFQTEEKGDSPNVVFFNTSGTKFELYPLNLLAQDINSTNPPEIANGFGGITLAYNVKSETEVIETIELARKAGARIAKEPQKVFWGGFHAYFADPDGYYWEVAYNPYWNFDEQEMIQF